MKYLIYCLMAGLLTCLSFNLVHAKQKKSTVQGQIEPTIKFDETEDLLSIKADQQSLKLVLDRIAYHSGLELLFNDLADKTISVNIQAKPLEKALKQILKGDNYLLRYQEQKQGKSLLIGVMVLPTGEENGKDTNRTQAIQDEAYHRTRSALSLEKVQQMDVVTERWQARLSEMPDQTREKLIKHVESRLLASVKKENLRKERNEKLQKKREKRKESKRLEEEKALAHYTPEQRATLEQRRLEEHEKMRLLLQNQN